jgi:hypothetical protein
MSTDSPKLISPSAARVAQRALSLAAVVCRGAIESDAGNADAEAFRASVVSWVDEVGVADELEPHEVSMLMAPLGSLTPRQLIDATWRTEGLAVLAWALGRYELPPYDIQARAPDVALALGFLEKREDTVLSKPLLRPALHVAALADSLFSLHWRLRQFSLDQLAVDFADVARRASFGPLPIDSLRLLERDLELRGVPISRAPEELWRTAMSIARERQQAANWLQGQDAVYSEVTADT